MLARLRGRCFSKTARSHRHARRQPGPRGSHLEAVGRLDRLVPQSILRRRLADDGPERPTERPQAREADVVADVGDAPLGLAQQEHRPLDTATLEMGAKLSFAPRLRRGRGCYLRRGNASTYFASPGY